MSLVSSAANRPYRTIGRRLSAAELIDHGRTYLARCGLPADSQDVALEVGYTLATVGPSASLRESLTQRLAARKPNPEPEPEPEKKRAWGVGRTARLELRVSPRERSAYAAEAARRGVSVGEFLREAANLAMPCGLSLSDRQAVTRGEQPAQEQPRDGWAARAERANERILMLDEAREALRALIPRRP